MESIRLKALRQAATPSVFGFRLGGIDTSQEEPSRTTRLWLKSFAKYVFYWIAQAIARLMSIVLGLLVYLIGANEWLRRVSGMDLSILELGATVREGSAANADLEQTVSESSAAGSDSDGSYNR